MNAKGTFEVKLAIEPPYDVEEGVSLGRVNLDKRFVGGLEATSKGVMLGARTPLDTSAGYVAIERVTGILAGKRGTFVLQHSGSMSGGAMTLLISIVPNSGTGELQRISGKMDIQIVKGQHFYDLDYDLETA